MMSLQKWFVISVIALTTISGLTFAQTCEDVCMSPDLNISYGECIALTTLYSTNGGAFRTNQTNWTISPDVSTWHGVVLTTGSNPRHIQELILPANNVQGELASALASLTFLKRLDLQDNAISSLPNSLQSLTQMEELIVANNDLTELPDIFTNRGSLDLLRAEGNQITNLPLSLGKLYELDLLDLSNNQLTILPTTIGDLDDLDILKVAHNQLTVLPNPISDLDQLALLDAQSNYLTIRPTQIEQLVTLESLQLQNNAFTNVPAALFSLPSLHHINLRNNSIAQLPEGWDGSSSLQIIDLGENRLSSLPSVFSTLDGLTQLYLHENRLTTFPSSLLSLSELQLLHLAFNVLTGLLPDSFSQQNAFSYLDVSYNKLNHTANGDVIIQDNLVDRVSREGFILHGEGQQTETENRFQQTYLEPFPQLATTSIVRTIELAPGLRFSLEDEQTPMVIVSGTGARCSQLEATLTLTASGSYELLLQPQAAGVYAGCFLQLVNQRGELSAPREIPGITVVTESQATFCDDPALTVEKSACLALLQFFVATDGLNRTSSDGWFVHPRVHERYGIETAEGTTKRKITGIYLHSSTRQPGASPIQGNGNMLSGFLPDIFASLPDLVTIALGKNNLSGSLPSSLGTLSRLAYLYLPHNKFNGLLTDVVSGLSSLRKISVQQNNFSGIVGNTFEGLIYLEAIDLRDNNFSGPLPDFSPQAPLFYMHVANNNFTGPLPEDRSSISTLQHVYLQGNQLEGMVPLSRNTWTGVKYLEISANALQRTPDKSAVLDASLIPRWQGLTQKGRANQRDIIAPSIELLGGWTATGANAYQIRIEIDENNYALDAFGGGMPVVIGGAAGCDELEASDVQVNTGSTLIIITPSRAGIFENCIMTVLDHGENYSNTVDLPILGHNLGEQSICLDPNLSIPLDECRVLREFFTATDGENRTNKNNRWQSPQVGTRFGLQTTTIAGQQHVSALLLHRNEFTSLNDPIVPQSRGNNLQGTLPDALRDLNYLTHVRLDHNALTGTPRDALVGLDDIQVITLSHNNFEESLPVHRGGFTKLTSLDLSNNTFTGSLPLSRKGLHALKTLRLGKNNLGGLIQVASGDWGALEEVDLSANAFSGSLDTDWSTQKSLKEFYLHNNLFGGSVPSSWSVLTGITKMNLSNNKLSGPFPVGFQAWTNMKEFSLSGNSVHGDINTVFPSRGAIEKLDITANKFTGRFGQTRTNLGEVEQLFAARNHLDRMSTHEAIISTGISSRLNQLVQYTITDQFDTTAPKMSSPSIIWSPVTNVQQLQLSREENSYSSTTTGLGLSLRIAGGGNCTSMLMSTGVIFTQTGMLTLLLQPQVNGVHTCRLTLNDHAGNEGRLQITPFLYNQSCGDSQITFPEECDEGRFCENTQNSECTQDMSICSFSCTTTMVDNCTPSCRKSICGDRYLDTNGLDNIAGTQDDEVCDVGSFCADGRDCTNNPSICPGGSAGCMTRFTPSCSPVCAPSSCGDLVVDEDGENNVLDDEDIEDCDDGNTISGDGCSSSCKVEYCGDGFIDANGADQLANTPDDEECDVGPGNGLRAGQCNQFCKVNEQTCQWCFETCQGGTGNHSIYLLIDVSGSMEGNKMQKAKQGAIDFVQHIMSGSAVNSGFVSKVGLIKFSSNGTVVHTPSTNYNQLISSIQALQAGGSTNFGDPLYDAKSYFDANDGGFEKHIVLLSDGLPTVGTSNLNAEDYSIVAANAIKASGVRLYTIAVEQTEEGIEFMRNLSSAAYVNLAAGRTPTQSSTQSSNSASRAVDADKGNYAQTRNDAKAWWQVDLGSAYEVREIKVRNRSNLGNQMSNFYVFGSATPFTSTNLTTTLAQSGVVAQYHTGTAQRPTTFMFDSTLRYIRVQLAGTNRLQLAEVEVFGCDGTENCNRIFSFEDYTSEVISTLYGHIFGSIHCGCGPYQVCGICGDGVVDPTYGEVCDEGSSCNDGRSCSADPSICPTECRPRTTQTCTQLCQLPSCGDGLVQTGLNEVCDDGNQRIGDGCSATCTHEVCGDGVVDINGADNILGTVDDEQCDDGNTINGDGCSATCKSEFCGDGQVLGSELCDTGRSCDNGNDCTNNPWLCPGQCKTRFKQGCSPDCAYGYCGDLIVDTDGANNISGDTDDEQCDPGKFCPNGIPCSHDESLCPGACEVTFTPNCTDHCKTTYCGDGFVDLDGVDDDFSTTYDNEQCDDGNGVNGDGCSSTCLLETEIGCTGTSCLSTCQDGIKQFFEPCDPTDPNDELSDECTQLCTLSVCGDGIVWEDEQCDAGKRCDDMITSCTDDPMVCPTGPGECQPRYIQGCTETCELGCGDGDIQPAGRDGILGNADDEQCDDGNTRNTDTCTNTCKRPECGDGIITYYAQLPTLNGGTVLYYETCDDGNKDDGDDCPSTCIGSGEAMTGDCSELISSYMLYNIRNFTFDDITQFCEKGIPDGSPIYDEQLKQRTWICHGILGGANNECVLPGWSCGDGVVDVRVDIDRGISIEEACDDGNNVDGDGCSQICEFESPLDFGEKQRCTLEDYPTIQSGEILPLWRDATVIGNYSGSCDTATTNMLFDKEKMMCTFSITRGNPLGYAEQVGQLQVPCLNNLATMSGGMLIRDAILDQGGVPEEIVGGTYVEAEVSSAWMGIGTYVYGQYRLDLTTVSFPYCALTRTNILGGKETTTSRQTHIRSYTSESLCSGSWSVVPGYLMQQQVLFSEQPNTGLDLAITNLSGDSLYLADSSYNQGAKLVQYTGPEKLYLFSEITELYKPLATDPYMIATANDSSTTFKKVPNSHVYVYTEQHNLYLERSQIEYLLLQAGVASTKTTETPFTIILPDSRAKLHLIGDIPGRGMYVAQDSITFVAQNCDAHDSVQGLFVTNGDFYTTTTLNTNPLASSRCNGGSLTINGLTLGGNISATLGNVRRATLNLREEDKQRYAGETNVSYLLDQLYRICYDVPLLSDAFGTVMGQASAQKFGGPFSGCTLQTSVLYKQMQEDEGEKLIDRLLKPAGFFDKALHEQNSGIATAFLKLLETGSSPRTEQTGSVGSLVTTFLYKQKAYALQIPSWKIQQISTAGKQLPSFWGPIVDLNDTVVRGQFLAFLRRINGPVKTIMEQFMHPLEGTPSLHQLLVTQWGSGYETRLIGELPSLTPPVCTTIFQGSDGHEYTNQTSCLLSYTPLYRWMIQQSSTYNTQKTQKDKQLLDGASIQIRSAPFLRKNPPPGARDLLQSMKISF